MVTQPISFWHTFFYYSPICSSSFHFNPCGSWFWARIIHSTLTKYFFLQWILIFCSHLHAGVLEALCHSDTVKLSFLSIYVLPYTSCMPFCSSTISWSPRYIFWKVLRHSREHAAVYLRVPFFGVTTLRKWAVRSWVTVVIFKGQWVLELPTLDDVDSTLHRNVRILLPTHVASLIYYVTDRTYIYIYIYIYICLSNMSHSCCILLGFSH